MYLRKLFHGGTSKLIGGSSATSFLQLVHRDSDWMSKEGQMTWAKRISNVYELFAWKVNKNWRCSRAGEPPSRHLTRPPGHRPRLGLQAPPSNPPPFDFSLFHSEFSFKCCLTFFSQSSFRRRKILIMVVSNNMQELGFGIDFDPCSFHLSLKTFVLIVYSKIFA